MFSISHERADFNAFLRELRGFFVLNFFTNRGRSDIMKKIPRRMGMKKADGVKKGIAVLAIARTIAPFNYTK